MEVLSPKAQNLLSQELSKLLNKDVKVPKEVKVNFLSRMISNKYLLIIAGILFFTILFTSFFTNLVVPIFLAYLLIIISFTAIVLYMTREVEHMDSSVAAQLEQEGVKNPDLILTQLATQYKTKKSKQVKDQRNKVTPDNYSKPVGFKDLFKD